MYTVKMNDGKSREVERGEGLELVAGKQARWEPPLVKQMVANGDYVRERTVKEDGTATVTFRPATAADSATAKPEKK